MSDFNSWKKIWNNREIDKSREISLLDLIKINGFDTGAGAHTVESWSEMIEYTSDKLEISESNKICEIGCGAGAFLFPFKNKDVKIYGIDYSEKLLEVCKGAIPNGTFMLAEANDVPFEDDYFNHIISHSIFQYLPSLEYAKGVIVEISRLLKKGGSAAILDVNDNSKKDMYEKIRSAEIGLEAYREKYKDTPHQFYDKEWIREVGRTNNLEVNIEDQKISDYGNSQFRYNIFIKKI
jgi:ubiquinone/menaquinone biosynthesis C-methylase UbiE